jgi:hypothetical protein
MLAMVLSNAILAFGPMVLGQMVSWSGPQPDGHWFDEVLKGTDLSTD